MLLGSLLHLLFQEAIKTSKTSKSDLNLLLSELLKRKIIVSQLFEGDINVDNIMQEAVSYLESIEKWLREYVKIKPTLTKNNNFTNNSKSTFSSSSNNNKNNEMKFQVLNVQDIEESIWSPKYGVKGKLDLTLQIEKHKEISIKKQTTIEIDTIPVELKSGRSTFSVEHEGQVMLYALLNKEKRKFHDYGLLLYLKDAKMKFIKTSHNNLKGLIQLRNDLVHFISSNGLPSLKEEERFCSKCSLLTVCSLFNDKTIELNKKIKYETNMDLYERSISHLTENHIKYFFKWYKMLDLEFQNEKQFDSGDLIWNKNLDDLEKIGYTVSNLKLFSSNLHSLPNLIEKDISSFSPFEFRRDNNSK
jgi:DNA replication ATP-dependent helicase Dna2